MNRPIVVVTQGSHGYTIKVEWFENERAFYADAVTLVMQLDEAAGVWWYLPKRVSSDELGTAAVKVIEVFEACPWTDVSRFATHFVPEPGAPLEPVPEVAA